MQTFSDGHIGTGKKGKCGWNTAHEQEWGQQSLDMWEGPLTYRGQLGQENVGESSFLTFIGNNRPRLAQRSRSLEQSRMLEDWNTSGL